MPNIFRNSPIDSLTQSVNALRSRQLQAQDNQVRMMELSSDLATKEAERQLLPRRLEMEERRLTYEMELGKTQMDLEVVKTVEGVLSTRMSRAIAMNEEFRSQKRLPFEMAQLDIETRALALELSFLPVLKKLELIGKVNMNTLVPLQKLTASIPGLVQGQLGAQQSKITSSAVQGEAIQQFTGGMFTQTADGTVVGIKHKGMRQMYDVTRQTDAALSVGGFAGKIINDVMMGAAEAGGFLDERGMWTNPTDAQVEEALIKQTRETFEPKLIAMAMKDRDKFATQIDVLTAVQSTRDRGQVPSPEQLLFEEQAKDQMLAHITLEQNGKFKFHDEPQPGSVTLSIWENFFGGPNAVVAARDYISASSDFNKAEIFSSGMIEAINKVSTSSTAVLAGETPQQAKDLLEEVDVFRIEYEEFIKRMDEIHGEMSPSEMSVDMFENPSAWGIFGIEPNKEWGLHFFGEDPEENTE